MSRKSKRKQNPLDARIGLLAQLPGVASVDSEFHVDDDELAIFVELASLPDERQQVEWQWRFSEFMSEHFPDSGTPFTWMIIAKHGGDCLRAGLSQGRAPDQFCAHCQTRQHGLLDECGYCLQPLAAA